MRPGPGDLDRETPTPKGGFIPALPGQLCFLVRRVLGEGEPRSRGGTPSGPGGVRRGWVGGGMLLIFPPLLPPQFPLRPAFYPGSSRLPEASLPPRGRLCAPTPSLGGLDRAGQAGHLALCPVPRCPGTPLPGRPFPAPPASPCSSVLCSNVSPPSLPLSSLLRLPASLPRSLPPAFFLLRSPPGGLPGGGGGSSSVHPPGLA